MRSRCCVGRSKRGGNRDCYTIITKHSLAACTSALLRRRTGGAGRAAFCSHRQPPGPARAAGRSDAGRQGPPPSTSRSHERQEEGMKNLLLVPMIHAVVLTLHPTPTVADGTLDHLLCYKVDDKLEPALTADLKAELQPG